MKQTRRVLLLTACLLLLTTALASAHDWQYGLTHNCHDALILGEVVAVEEEHYTVAVRDTIVSVKSCGDFPKQIKPEAVTIRREGGEYIYSYYRDFSSESVYPALGEYVLAAVVLEKNGQAFAYSAVYQVDSLDKETLSLVLPDDYPVDVWWRMDCAAIEYFVRSDGQSADFWFDGTTYEVGARVGDSDVVIFKGEPDPVPSEAPLPGTSPQPPPEEEPVQTGSAEPGEKPADTAPEPTHEEADSPPEGAFPTADIWAIAMGMALLIGAFYWRITRKRRQAGKKEG